MNDQDLNFLWDPEHTAASPELRRVEQQLRHLGATARGLAEHLPPRLAALATAAPPTPRAPTWRRGWRQVVVMAASAAVLVMGLSLVLHLHMRLQWEPSRPWRVEVGAPGQDPRSSQLHVGEPLVLGEHERALLRVAGIGRVQLEPGAQLRLLETKSGQHRVELQQGRMKARIWAPPGHFGVEGGGALVLDLGCEFELDVDIHQNGRLVVLSGWVQIERGGHETLVPAGHSLLFDAERIETPVRTSADAELRHALARLDQALLIGSDVESQAEAVAALAKPDDLHSLLSLLTRHPELARSGLYPRLFEALELPLVPSQRAAWSSGDVEVINHAWRQLPQAPKAWWRHWRDAF